MCDPMGHSSSRKPAWAEIERHPHQLPVRSSRSHLDGPTWTVPLGRSHLAAPTWPVPLGRSHLAASSTVFPFGAHKLILRATSHRCSLHRCHHCTVARLPIAASLAHVTEACPINEREQSVRDKRGRRQHRRVGQMRSCAVWYNGLPSVLALCASTSAGIGGYLLPA